MSKSSNLQKKIAMLRLELRMQQLVNRELMAEVIEGNRVISLLESEVSRLQDRVQCCEHDDSSPEELDAHIRQHFAEYLQEAPAEAIEEKAEV